MSFPKALELRMSGLRIAAGALLLAGCGAPTPDAAVSAGIAPAEGLFYILCRSYGQDNRIFERLDGRIVWR